MDPLSPNDGLLNGVVIVELNKAMEEVKDVEDVQALDIPTRLEVLKK